MKKATSRRGRERRGSERADARLSMRVEAGATGAAKIVTESQNISASGVYSHASHYLAPLSKIQLTIVLPRTPGNDGTSQELVKCDGIVVRCDQRVGDRSETPYELACMFTGLENGLRRRIDEFVAWRNLQALRAALTPGHRGRAVAARSPRGMAVVRGAERNLASPRRAAANAKPERRKPGARAAASPGGAKKVARAGAARATGRAKR